MIAGHARIFVATAPIDFRGSFDRLAGAVRAHLQQDPRSGAYFVFFNRNADRVKVFFFDQTYPSRDPGVDRHAPLNLGRGRPAAVSRRRAAG